MLLAAPFPGSGPAGLLFASEIAALTSEGMSTAHAARAIAVSGEIAQAGLVLKLLAAMGSAYAGVWFVPAAAQIHVGFTSPAGRRSAEQAVADAGLSSATVLTAVHSTWAQILATQRRWNVRLAQLLASAQAETALAPQHNAVTVRLAASVPARERAAVEHAGSASSVNVLITVVPPAQLRFTRGATKCNIWVTQKAYCDKPITPGVRIESEKGIICSAGPLAMPTADKQRTYLLTAGHCIIRAKRARGAERLPKWYAFNTKGEKAEIGKSDQALDNANADIGAIKVNTPGKWGLEGNTPVYAVTAEWAKKEETSFPLKGQAEPPMVGNPNCLEGQTSGGMCGTVKETGVTLLGTGGLVEDATATSGRGDSGGAEISETKGEYLADGTNVGFRGSGLTVWEPIATAFTRLNLLGLELITTANEVRPKESAKEKEANEKLEKEEKEEEEGVIKPTKEEEEKAEKEEKEEAEEEGKEGNPLISPAPTGAAPLEFTATSGKTILETVGKSKIECKEDAASGSFSGVRAGTTTFDFHGCKSTGFACLSTGDASEVILATGSVELVDLEKSSKLVLGLKVGLNEFHVECAGVISASVRGAVIGEVTGVESGKKTKAATVLFKQEKGKQAIKECHLTKKACEGKKFLLEASVGGGGFEEAGLETEEKLTFAKEDEFDF